MIVTLDGPSGTGKSTIAKLLAQKLGFSYFDTGAMYRSLAWYLIDKKVDISNPTEIEQVLPNFTYTIKEEGASKNYLVCGADVTEKIRSKEITEVVSPISAYKIVRDLLSKIQKKCGENGNSVFEGRDLGSVVFPQAECKIFLTARPEIRAKRRYLELLGKNPSLQDTEESILEAINKRDQFDSNREHAPLKCPENAYVVDTSDMTIDQVVEKILTYVRKKIYETL